MRGFIIFMSVYTMGDLGLLDGFKWWQVAALIIWGIIAIMQDINELDGRKK